MAIIFIGYMGYSIAVTTGLYTPATTTSHTELSKSQLESIRNALVQNGDSNVKGTTNNSATQTTTVATTEQTTTK